MRSAGLGFQESSSLPSQQVLPQSLRNLTAVFEVALEEMKGAAASFAAWLLWG